MRLPRSEKFRPLDSEDLIPMAMKEGSKNLGSLFTSEPKTFRKEFWSLRRLCHVAHLRAASAEVERCGIRVDFSHGAFTDFGGYRL